MQCGKGRGREGDREVRCSVVGGRGGRETER